MVCYAGVSPRYAGVTYIGGARVHYLLDRINAMPFVPVDQACLVEIRMEIVGQKVENTIWVTSEDLLDEAALTLIGETVKAWWISDYAPQVSDLVSLTEIVVTNMTTETSNQVSVNGDHQLGGQIGGTLTTNSTFAVSFRTASRGRSFRGRNYIVGIPLEHMAETNVVEASWASDVVTAYTNLLSQLGDAGFQWVIASRFSGVDPDTGKPIPRTAGVTTNVITVVAADLVIDSQRRRLPGRGQ